jgi:Na+:H+ antiporter, NhaA family
VLCLDKFKVCREVWSASQERIPVAPKIKHAIHRLSNNRVSSIFKTFLKDESISGKLILGATVLALFVVNSNWRHSYEMIWQLDLGIGLGSWSLSQDLRHWINEGLMAFFFLVVGLEIKRELVRGELQDLRAAILPVGAAIGGMLVPAVFYLSLNQDPEAIKGWGIPIATDIAFAVGVLMLLGRRVPLSLKLFLLTLAIVDDIGAIFVIALYYAEIIHYGYLFASIGLVIVVWLLRKRLINHLSIFLILGTVLWVTTHLSGIHASIVGAALGLLAPMTKDVARISVAQRLEKLFLPLSTFIALPVFAFANAGIVVTLDSFANQVGGTVMQGIVLGLVGGKVLGIFGASLLLVKIGVARLPEGVRWPHIMGVGLIAGIGFTVSIFITELAFSNNHQLIETAKISIFLASILSAILGSLVLLGTKHKEIQPS